MKKIYLTVLFALGPLLLVGCGIDYSNPLPNDQLKRFDLTEDEELQDYLKLKKAMARYSTLQCDGGEKQCLCEGEACLNKDYEAEYLQIFCGLNEKYPDWKNGKIHYHEKTPDPQALTKIWFINFNYMYVKHRAACEDKR